jgi:hypothetical protein
MHYFLSSYHTIPPPKLLQNALSSFALFRRGFAPCRGFRCSAWHVCSFHPCPSDSDDSLELLASNPPPPALREIFSAAIASKAPRTSVPTLLPSQSSLTQWLLIADSLPFARPPRSRSTGHFPRVSYPLTSCMAGSLILVQPIGALHVLPSQISELATQVRRAVRIIAS